MKVLVEIRKTIQYEVELNAKTFEEAKEQLSLASEAWYDIHAVPLELVDRDILDVKEIE